MKSNKLEKHYILEDNIKTLFLKLSIPSVIGMVIMGLYQFVDGIYIGQWVGQDAVAAIGIVFPFALVFNGFSSMLGIGASSLLSRTIGKNDFKRLHKICTNLFLLNIIVSISIYVFLQIFSNTIFGFLTDDIAIIKYCKTYINYLSAGIFFLNTGSSLNMIMRANGNMNSAMNILAAGAILNIILGPIFIYFLDLGIAGAGLSTISGQFLSMILVIIYFLKTKKDDSSYLKSFFYFNFKYVDKNILKEILKVGLSALALPLILLIQMFFVFKFIEYYGSSDDLALIGALMRILNFIFIPIWGVVQGMQPVIGINFGAQKYKRVKDSFLFFTLATTIYAIIMWGILFFLSKKVLFLFITSPEVVEMGIKFMRIFLSIFPLYGFMITAITYFQAIGKGHTATALVLSRTIFLFIPILYILTHFFGRYGIYLTMPVADSIIITFSIWLIYKSITKLLKQEGTLKL